MNKVLLIGRITRDVELKRINNQNATAVASFTLAINRIGAKDGQQQADFINCVVFGKQAENLAKYCAKGSQVGVDGSIQTRTYDNSQGQKVYVTEVLCNNIEYLSHANQQQSQAHVQQNDPFYSANNTFNIQDDDIAF